MMPAFDYADRLRRFRAQLAATEAQAALISAPANIRYLSGFTGSYGALLVAAETSSQAMSKDAAPPRASSSAAAAFLISDFRYRYQAAEQAPGFEFIEIRRWVDGVAAAIRRLDARRVGFETAHLAYQLHAQLAAELEGFELLPLEGAVEKLRAVKQPAELECIQRAAAVTDGALARVMSLLRVGITERELALAAEDFIRKEGGMELAFPPIVASGARSAQCHAVPGSRQLAPGDMVIMDVGARWQGYGADLTRTVAVQRADAKQREIYSVCYQAQAAALAAVRPGARCGDLDRTARTVIESAGYGEYFGHGLGHGLGLETAELPRLTTSERLALRPHMTVTIEPGIYTLEAGGVRLEDLVVVTEEGCRVLTQAPKPSELPTLP
jgi:Xaa-Pro aminopeptidase